MTKSNDMEKVLAKIRKMLAMAENDRGDNINESAVAASMAEKLMRKFNLSHADVLLEELDDDSMVAYETNVGYKSRVPTWVSAIIVATARLHDCEAQYNHEGYRNKTGYHYKKIITFLGDKGDVIVAAWVFEYLMKEIKRHTNNYKKEYGASNIATDSFRKGCASEVANTIMRMTREKEEEVRQHTTGTALVIRKKELIKEKFKVEYSKGNRTRMGDWGAAMAGREAGASISVRQGINSEGKATEALK